MSDSQHNPTLVTSEAARAVEPKVQSPDALAIEEARNNHQREMLQANGGFVGRIIGSGTEKAGNVAFIVIICCIIFSGITFLRVDITTESEVFLKVLSFIFGPISLALGYLFGSGKNR